MSSTNIARPLRGRDEIQASRGFLDFVDGTRESEEFDEITEEVTPIPGCFNTL